MLPRATRLLPRCRAGLPALRCRRYVRAEDYDASLRHLFRPRRKRTHEAKESSFNKAPNVFGAEPQAKPLRPCVAAGMAEAAGDDPLPKLTPCVCADRKGACGGSVAAPNPLVDPSAVDAAAVAQITAMGFSEPAARRGLLATDGSVGRAVQWVTAHAGDADLNEPLPEPAAAGGAAAADEPEPLFAFGVVADVQYADLPVGTNFLKTVTRYYRHALDGLSLAVSSYLHDAPGGKPVAFVAQLGDLLDGQNADHGQTAAAAADAHAVLSRLGDIPVHSVIGNHEVMNWTRAQLHARAKDQPKPDDGG